MLKYMLVYHFLKSFIVGQLYFIQLQTYERVCFHETYGKMLGSEGVRMGEMMVP